MQSIAAPTAQQTAMITIFVCSEIPPGELEGSTSTVGKDDGCPEGTELGIIDGCPEGTELGTPVGNDEGCREGTLLGAELGCEDGTDAISELGAVVGQLLG